MKTTLYDILKPIQYNLKCAYNNGANIPHTLLRDIEIYELYLKIRKKNKTEKYTLVSDRLGVSDTVVRKAVRYMGGVVVG